MWNSNEFIYFKCNLFVILYSRFHGSCVSIILTFIKSVQGADMIGLSCLELLKSVTYPTKGQVYRRISWMSLSCHFSDIKALALILKFATSLAVPYCPLWPIFSQNILNLFVLTKSLLCKNVQKKPKITLQMFSLCSQFWRHKPQHNLSFSGHFRTSGLQKSPCLFTVRLIIVNYWPILIWHRCADTLQQFCFPKGLIQ